MHPKKLSGKRLQTRSSPQPAQADDLLYKLAILQAAYKAGLLGNTVHELYPDIAPDSRLRFLYFTLAPALNYQRKSESLWRAALATYEDPETSFVFDPLNLHRGVDQYRNALTRHGLALQPSRQTSIWFTISTTLATGFRSDPRELLQACDYDVLVVKALISQRHRSFPYLSGPKLLNYWLYMLSTFTSTQLRNREEISVVPDIHVTRATIALGLADDDSLCGPVDVERRWRTFLAGSSIAACDLHAPLWRWARSGFPDIAELSKLLRTVPEGHRPESQK
ncbi:MAG: hypothetical protein ACR2M4_06945 [Actinomycetota bacterium]